MYQVVLSSKLGTKCGGANRAIYGPRIPQRPPTYQQHLTTAVDHGTNGVALKETHMIIDSSIHCLVAHERCML